MESDKERENLKIKVSVDPEANSVERRCYQTRVVGMLSKNDLCRFQTRSEINNFEPEAPWHLLYQSHFYGYPRFYNDFFFYFFFLLTFQDFLWEYFTKLPAGSRFSLQSHRAAIWVLSSSRHTHASVSDRVALSDTAPLPGSSEHRGWATRKKKKHQMTVSIQRKNTFFFFFLDSVLLIIIIIFFSLWIKPTRQSRSCTKQFCSCNFVIVPTS